MDPTRALEVIQSLAAGIDPYSGEVFASNHTLQNPEVVRALFLAAQALQAQGVPAAAKPAPATGPKSAGTPTGAGRPWSKEEEERLAQAFDAGTDEKELAARHQRTRGAIRARLVKLGKLEPSAYPGLRGAAPTSVAENLAH